MIRQTVFILFLSIIIFSVLSGIIFWLYPAHLICCSILGFITVFYGLFAFVVINNYTNGEPDPINVEEEKFKIIHHYRKVHEAEYINFIATIKDIVDAKKE